MCSCSGASNLPNRVEWKRVLKGFAGFFVGLAVWLALSPPYNRAIAGASEAILRLAESPSVTRLRPEETEIIVDRDDFPPRSARPGVPLQDLTFNIILLVTLFASSAETFSNRNIVGFLFGCLILYATHVFGLIAAVQTIYALKLGAWSEAVYGPISRNFWSGFSHFYRLVGLYAFAFAIWWGLRPSESRPAEANAGRKKKRRRKK